RPARHADGHVDMWAEAEMAIAHQHRYRVVASVRRQEIERAVAVDVRGAERSRASTRRERVRGAEPSVASTEEDGDRVRIAVGHRDADVVIPVEVAGDDRI